MFICCCYAYAWLRYGFSRDAHAHAFFARLFDAPAWCYGFFIYFATLFHYCCWCARYLCLLRERAALRSPRGAFLCDMLDACRAGAICACYMLTVMLLRCRACWWQDIMFIYFIDSWCLWCAMLSAYAMPRTSREVPHCLHAMLIFDLRYSCHLIFWCPCPCWCFWCHWYWFSCFVFFIIIDFTTFFFFWCRHFHRLFYVLFAFAVISFCLLLMLSCYADIIRAPPCYYSALPDAYRRHAILRHIRLRVWYLLLRYATLLMLIWCRATIGARCCATCSASRCNCFAYLLFDFIPYVLPLICWYTFAYAAYAWCAFCLCQELSLLRLFMPRRLRDAWAPRLFLLMPAMLRCHAVCWSTLYLPPAKRFATLMAPSFKICRDMLPASPIKSRLRHKIAMPRRRALCARFILRSIILPSCCLMFQICSGDDIVLSRVMRIIIRSIVARSCLLIFDAMLFYVFVLFWLSISIVYAHATVERAYASAAAYYYALIMPCCFIAADAIIDSLPAHRHRLFILSADVPMPPRCFFFFPSCCARYFIFRLIFTYDMLLICCFTNAFFCACRLPWYYFAHADIAMLSPFLPLLPLCLFAAMSLRHADGCLFAGFAIFFALR